MPLNGPIIIPKKERLSTESSSIITEVIRTVLNFLIFFSIRFYKYKKA